MLNRSRLKYKQSQSKDKKALKKKLQSFFSNLVLHLINGHQKHKTVLGKSITDTENTERKSIKYSINPIKKRELKETN